MEENFLDPVISTLMQRLGTANFLITQTKTQPRSLPHHTAFSFPSNSSSTSMLLKPLLVYVSHLYGP